jgi:hypothetical protein
VNDNFNIDIRLVHTFAAEIVTRVLTKTECKWKERKDSFWQASQRDDY